MKQIYFLLIGLFLANLFAFGQTTIDFKEFKPLGDGKVVYFGISGLDSDDKSENIMNIFKNDPNIFFHKIYKQKNNQYRCKLEIKRGIEANYVQNLLRTENLDFDLNTMNVKVIRTDGLPEHYPSFVNSGNAADDNLKHEMTVEKWREQYPDEYKAIGYGKVRQGRNGEPPFIDTGNPESDKLNYEKSKQAWAKGNSDSRKVNQESQPVEVLRVKH